MLEVDMCGTVRLSLERGQQSQSLSVAVRLSADVSAKRCTSIYFYIYWRTLFIPLHSEA